MFGVALLDLADLANCISGDFHVLHLNVRGLEFDTLHKQVLKTYYEQAAEDYDSWAEAALMFEDTEAAPNPNESGKRIEYQSYDGTPTRDEAIAKTKDLLELYFEALVTLFRALEQEKEDAKCIGVSNTLQTRIEYWSKELHYFNARRN